MTAGATIHAATPAVTADPGRPIVLLDGVPEPNLMVRELTIDGPLDERAMLLDASLSMTAASLRTACRRHATIVLPTRLSDGTFRWPVLAAGELTIANVERSSDRRRQRLRLIDTWTRQLSQTLGQTWWQVDGGLMTRDPAGVRIGPARSTGRSTHKWRIHERDVYVLEVSTTAWTVATCLDMLAAGMGIALLLTHLPPDIAREPIDVDLKLDQPFSDILRRLLDAHGLLLRRELRWEAGRTHGYIGVRPIDRGRPIALAWPADLHAQSPVLEVISEGQPIVSRAWIATAEPQRVESTFLLHPAWDPAAENALLPDTTFSRVENPGFPAYANVYRLWVLNEDGRYTQPPYQLDTFNLAQFFGDAGVGLQPLAFEDCLTLDDASLHRTPIVEIRTNTAEDWVIYPGEVSVLRDRAGVYLGDATLPTSILAAARAGTLAIRVTATLTSPHPTKITRWQGNPFAGSQPPHRLSVAGQFRFMRVAPQSRHAAGLAAGLLTASQANDHYAMITWLTRRMRRDRRRTDERLGRARLRLLDPMPLLHIGDRIRHAGGPGRDPRGRPEANHPDPTTVRRIVCRWIAADDGDSLTGRTMHGTELQLEF